MSAELKPGRCRFPRGTLTLKSSTVTNNTAFGGGGIATGKGNRSVVAA